MNVFSKLVTTTAIAAAMLAPIGAQAEGKVGSAVFSGIVNHVSSNNIKVTDNRSHQSLSFLILPKFNQVFSSDGKTTYQMTAIKAGQYVKVYYDQKMLGSRHADRILLLTQGNLIKGRQ
jgi:hypothetical protein